MIKMLIDTCVWLDLAKDPKQEPLLSVIEEMVQAEVLHLLVPRTIINEFNRHKNKIIVDSQKGLSTHFRMVKQSVDKFGDVRKKKKVIKDLEDMDHQIALLGSSFAAQSIPRIELLLNKNVIELNESIILEAANRGLYRKAPFHLKNKNSIDDAVILETYAAVLNTGKSPGIRFAFVTHNVSDFSNTNINNKYPHPDITQFFTARKSIYFISLAEAIHRYAPELISERMMEFESSVEPRGISDIVTSSNELADKIWYNRHQNWLYQIEIGENKIVPRSEYKEYNPRITPDDIFNGARKAAVGMEKLYGIENLGPWDDFEWGMLNGKLSALRWVLGSEWDDLDT